MKIDKLLLNNNKINKYSELNYTEYIDLSGNVIDTVSGVQRIRGKYPVIKWKLHTIVLLNDNPLKDIEDIKNLSINILPINEYETSDADDLFKNVRDTTFQSKEGIQFYLTSLFESINDRCIYVCVGNVKLDGFNTILGKDIRGMVHPDKGYDNNEFIIIPVNRKYEWAEFLQYFGLKVENKKKSLTATQILFIIVIVSILIIYMLHASQN